MRSAKEISLEISALELDCGGFDTDEQTDKTCIAVGAHDALRWALGLAENPISEYVRPA